jgi:hypothetical protein
MIQCQKTGCGKEIELVDSKDGAYYAHVKPANHNAQVPLKKGPSA